MLLYCGDDDDDDVNKTTTYLNKSIDLKFEMLMMISMMIDDD